MRPGVVPGHEFRCWFPVGTPEGAEALARNQAAGVGAADGGLYGRHRDRAPAPRDDVLLRVEDLVVEFHAEGGKVKAVSGISLDLVAGETLGLVGESGCGKSTTGRAVMQLPRPTSGTVRFDGIELTAAQGQRAARDPAAAADDLPGPDLVAEPAPQGRRHRRRGPRDLEHRRRRRRARRRSTRCSSAVGLDPDTTRNRRPHEFSGGQCQRISIARAVITDPKLIICDEPVSALDVSVQAQILNLLEDMKQRYKLTMLFIAHDLAVVKNVSDRVAVMYLGKLCEVGAPDVLYAQPAHPYTAALLAAIPVPDPGVTARRHAGARRRDPVEPEPAERVPVPHPLPEGPGALRRGGARRSATWAPTSSSPATSRSTPGEAIEFRRP